MGNNKKETYNTGIDLVVAITTVLVAIANGNKTCLFTLAFDTFLLLVLVNLPLDGI